MAMKTKLGEGSTPGPWHTTMVDCKVRGAREQWAMGISTDEFVADVGGRDKATAQANSCLISKAPLLIEAREVLRDINRWFEVQLSRGRINAGTANRDGDLVSQIRALLAKLEE